MKHFTLLLVVTIWLACGSINAQTQKPTPQNPNYESTLKTLREQVDKLQQKLDESQKDAAELSAMEKAARDAGLTAPREHVPSYDDLYDYYPYVPRYYSSYFYSRHYPRYYYPRAYYPHDYYPRYHSPFRRQIYRH